MRIRVASVAKLLMLAWSDTGVITNEGPSRVTVSGPLATGCRSCVLFGAKTRRFEPGRAGDVNTLNTNRPIDAELASLGAVALTGFAVF